MTAPRAAGARPFDRVVVIFNPHGTGEAPQMAEQLRADLARRLPELPMQLCPTERAGHGREPAPIVAIDLEKGGKGSLREIVSVVRTFARFRPFTVELDDGRRHRFDSLLLATIAQMAKYATPSDTDQPDDGRFEIVALPHTSTLRILAVAIKAATRGLGPQPTATRCDFVTLTPTPLHLDGELPTLDAGASVHVEIAPAALATIT